jgi:hypothetical protein
MSCAESISFNIFHTANLSFTFPYATKIAFSISGKLLVYRAALLKAAHIIHIRPAVLKLGSKGRFQGVRELGEGQNPLP